VTVLLPPDVDGKTVITGAKVKYKKVKGEHRVDPVPPIATWDGEKTIVIWPKDKNIKDGKDVAIYDKNEFWPKKKVFLTQVGKLRIYNLAQIAVPLVQYNPVKKEIRKIKDTDVSIKYKTKEVGYKKKLDLIGKNRIKKLTINTKQFIREYE
jgi:hypothetical protein